MAGDWIPMRTDLAEDPAVIGIADATGLDEGGVVGRLHRLWSWASWHTEDGDVKGVTLAWINRHVQSDGFAEAMIKVGWLVTTKSGVRFPRFDEWNSQSAKKRRLTARRMASLRSHKSDASSVTKTSPHKSTEEKSKEEGKTIPPESPNGDGVKIDGHGMSIPESLRTGPFREMWTRWCDERRDRKQKQTRRGWETQLVKLARYGPDVASQAIEQSIANGWQGLFPEKIANGNANGTTNTFGNAGGNRGPVEPNRVRTATLLDQVDRERERAESAGGSAAGGAGEMQSSGSGDAQAGF